ncbi:MAG TPA: DUF2917 domain-containing protein [Variovorax sp.]|nr:DUF2917 domain-containing protein [Variovorax sp.]
MSSVVLAPSSSVSSMSRPMPAVPAAIAASGCGEAWQLAFGRAASLRAEAAGVLRVTRGRLWVTRDATRRRATEDLVLAPGDTLALATGERVVMEPWDARGAAYAWDAALNR